GDKASKEGRKYFPDLNIAAKAELYTYVPDIAEWQLDEYSSYVHITPNETIQGVSFTDAPKVEVPLVADMSSSLLSKPLDVASYGVIYAGAQKNIGPAGLTLVIAREDLLGKPRPDTPAIWNWSEQAENDSMIN